MHAYFDHNRVMLTVSNSTISAVEFNYSKELLDTKQISVCDKAWFAFGFENTRYYFMLRTLYFVFAVTLKLP